MPPAMSRSGRTARLRLALGVGVLTALASVPALAVDWSKAQRVTVVTVEYAFQPADLTFHHRVAYRLHIDNRGKETHEFTAPEFFKAIEMRDARALNADRTEIVIQPGETKDLYFVARQPGSYKLRCSDHDWAGMVGTITVVQ
jgi:uncharacterized cupredoxin-like copper-binding protein